ncbi:ABC transporter ATP-binding protein [Vibrio diabolicus]|jgi:ABC-2 type transport system ATP-binding protein|uniref:ABC transporter ATP-binding protein n=1 Tax=Vibrio TaxID=662 RepID=UPI0012447166|nr:MULTISPECIES: ABC transporter ATP-binding protein [Vibrio]MCS0030332.1 ABC transporter ATP-binding protein [Vibrio alginolyticus]KAB0320487.1 ABC transporter ATP-binding protein [Vibrio diabolicus]MCG9228366.1 ABC transporter ATP-binding protein [Vibrio diabolicus]MCG9569620.1 ABC transporter ATP-binding protein [Vibrio diabolicus]MCG9594024.1 ABC transporter ATP-binding protein [Vibrio diabolicus]
MSALVSVKNVSKQYQQQGEALHEVSFDLHAGQVLGLLGHNGAGKSTLINALLGAHEYQGTVRINGFEPIMQRDKIMQSLSYISDVNVLPDWMTVAQLLNYTEGVHPGFNRAQADTLLRQTDIKPRARIKSLSKGMKVQLHLAIVIATNTQILILDEPTLGLDLVYRDTFYRHLLEWFHDGERVLIIASHEVSEIEHLLTDVLILKHGRPVLQTSMDSISEDYFILEASDEYRTQIEAMNPLSSQKGLGSTKWLLTAQYAQQAETMGAIHGVKLADLFLALQKEAA